MSPPATGAENMALDEALMDRARATGEWVMRVYTWLTPTISLGRNQSARGRYDRTRIRDAGISVVRRPTGGRAILHDREITYSVTAPLAGAGDLGQSYGRINALLLHAVTSMGVAAAIASPVTRSIAPGMSPCFDEPAEGELIVGGRKLAGSAQWRVDGALLQHGSILVDDDQARLVSLAIDPRAAPPASATLREELGRAPAPEEVAVALADAIEALDGVRPAELPDDAALRARTSGLVVRYLDEAWTWRR